MTTTLVDPSARISDECEFADGVEVGPGCLLTGAVRLGGGVRLVGSVHLSGPVTIGEGTIVYPFACIGFPAQHRRFGPDSLNAGVVIGRDCVIREHVTIHSSTDEQIPTTIGDDVYMMCGSHAAHDCQIGNRVTMVNGAAAAGHVQIGDDVNLGGGVMIHQHCRIGRLSMLRGGAAVNLDVPPFCVLQEPNRIGGINVIGLRRADVPRDEITATRQAYRLHLHTPKPRPEVVAAIRSMAGESSILAELATWIEASERGITPGMGKGLRGIRNTAETDVRPGL